MKKILMATDFSEVAGNAAEYAADMAMAVNAELLLLHVYAMPVSYYEMPPSVSADEILQNAETLLDKLQKELSSKTGGKITITTEARMGSFFKELENICEQVKPYTVVLGSQGTTAAERILFGNHAVYAMKHLHWPLITIPPGVKFSSVKKIGLTCDFDKVVFSIPVDEIRTLVKDFNATLHILNTGKKSEFNPDVVFESGMLQEMLIDLKPEYHFITHEDVDTGIIEFADKNSIDLLIVLPKRHSLMERLTHKSHTKQLVLHSHVPVMALHE